jgi:hypothetical protein
MFVHYGIMWAILLVFKFSALAPLVDWTMFVPFWAVTYAALQLSRIAVAANSATTATLYLSFAPFAVFLVASRELHSYLSWLWFVFLLIVNVRGYVCVCVCVCVCACRAPWLTLCRGGICMGPAGASTRCGR